MLRGQLKDVSSWIRSDWFEPKMFGSKTTGSSTFYTDLHINAETESQQQSTLAESERIVTLRHSRLLEQQSTTSEDGNSQDSDSVCGTEEQQQFPRHSFHRIASFGGFPRFRPFVMSASTSAACTEVNSTQETTIESSYVEMSHSVLEYRSSRYIN